MIPVLELYSPMKKSFGSFFSTEAHADSEIIRYINEGAKLLCEKYPWYFNEKETTVVIANEDDIAPIQETIEILIVQREDGTEVLDIAVKLSDYKKMKIDGLSPVGIWDTTFKSSVTGTFTITHSVYPTKVIDIYGTIEFPDSVKNILMEYSLAIGYLSIKDDYNATQHMNFGNSLLPNQISRKSNRNPNTKKRVSSYNF